MPTARKNRGVAGCKQAKPSFSGSTTFTAKMADKAIRKLQERRRVLGGWREVAEETGIPFSTAYNVAIGRRPVNQEVIEKLGIRKPKRYYKNWRRKYLLLAAWVRRQAK